MRPYVKSIFSNLKSPKEGGEAWSLDLGQHTLLVGSNTSHKSSVIQSVELAIAGSADDIFGRSAVSDAALLLTLSPTDELGVTANLSNDKIKFNSSYNICREDGKVKRPNLDVPGAECLVHRSVMAALSGSAATARKAFLGWTGGTTDLSDVLEHLPEDLHSKYTDIVKFKGRNKTAVEGLLEVTNYAGQRQREAAKEAKGAEIIMENLGDDVAARPTDEDMDKMRFAIAEAKEILDVSIRASGSGMTVEQRDEEIKKAKEKHDFFVNQKGLIEQAMNEMRASLPDKGENVDHAIKIVDVAVKHNLDVCPVCSSSVGLEHLKTCQDFYKKQDADWSKQSENVISALSKMENDAQTYNQHLSEITFLLNKLETVELTQVDNRAINVNDAQARLEAAMAALSRMEQVRDEWDRLASAREKMISMKQDVDTYKRLKASCEVAVGKLLFARAEEFSARVQNYLPADWTFCIELLDGNKEVFRMGIKRDGRLHSALSGAEWTSVVTAISMSVAEGLAEGKPAILVPEDRAWDGKTLSSVMRGFSQFDGQVIMASTIRPTGRPPKGWTIIDMDEVSAEWCTGTVIDEVTEPVAQETEPIKKTSINHASGGFRVTTRSALILEESGFDTDAIQSMSRETVASIIKDGLAPENISVNDDGSYQIIRSAKVLPMPPAPKA
jgi:hypothetical protein